MSKRIIMLLLCCSTVLADDSLIYHQTFDDPVSGAQSTQGHIGRAGSFDGGRNYVRVGDLGDHSQLTIAVWVRPDSEQVADGDDYNGLVSSDAWQQGVMHFCYLGGRAHCILHLGEGQRARVATPALPKEKWSHVALVADVQDDRLAIYANGRPAQVASGIKAIGSIQLMQQVIGAEHAETHKRFFKGALDEVRIYNRVLSQKEILALCPGAPVLSEPTFNEKFRIQAIKSKQANFDKSNFPVYHYMAPFGQWFGDINGPVYHDGWFHVFYQWRVPGEQKICWGHARSRDLIDWQHLPVAVPPRGSRGSWSGATVVTKAGPRILFTSDYQQSGSTGSPDLIHWTPMTKEPAMPRMLHASQGVKINGWRDPFVWRHDGAYYSCVGGSVEGRGYVSLYRALSEELDSWEFVGPLFVHPDSPDNACPNFFKIRDKWVLLMSRHRPHVEDWFVGTWDTDTLEFHPEESGILGYNEATYATQGLHHPDGRVIYWNTIHQWRRANKPLDWPGCLSVPRELSVGPDNRVRLQPLAELTRLRGSHFHDENLELSDETRNIGDVQGDALEIRISMDPKDATSFGIVVRRSKDGTRGLEIRYRDTVYVDGQQPMYSVKHGKADDPVRKPFTLAPGEAFEVTILLDKICFEAFVNDRICFDRIIHPCDHTGQALELPTAQDLGIAVFAEGGTAVIKSVDVWKMNAIKMTSYEP